MAYEGLEAGKVSGRWASRTARADATLSRPGELAPR